MSSDASGWEKILQEQIQSATSSGDLNSFSIPAEAPFAVDLSNHHLHDQVLSDVRQTFEASVVADHIIEHLFPQVIAYNYEHPHSEVSPSFADANPAIEGFQASGIEKQISVPEENLNSFLDPNQSLREVGVLSAEPLFQDQQPSYEDQPPLVSDQVYNDVQALTEDPYHSIPREQHDHLQVSQTLIFADVSQSIDAFERERGLEIALAENEDGLAFRLDQEIRSHLSLDGDNGEF